MLTGGMAARIERYVDGRPDSQRRKRTRVARDHALGGNATWRVSFSEAENLSRSSSRFFAQSTTAQFSGAPRIVIYHMSFRE